MRIIAKILFIFLLFAQLGLAQHASVHFSEHVYGLETISHADHQQDSDHDHKNSDEQCQICLSAKIFSHVISADAPAIPYVIALPVSFEGEGESISVPNRKVPYAPRDPPLFLI